MTFRYSKLILYLALVFFLGPFFVLLLRSFTGSTSADREVWNFVLHFTLPGVFKNTFSLIFFSSLFSVIIGLGQSILIVLTNIKWKLALHILFVLPMAFPLYLLSYVYVGALEYMGPIPSYFRNQLGVEFLGHINLRGPLFISLVFSLALSPYVYLFSKSFLEKLDRKIIWSARTLGKGPFGLIFSLIIPQSLPWIMSSVIFVTLEVLCDFGGVAIFNFETFSTAIHQSWINLFSFNTAAKISLFPMLFALSLFYINYHLAKHTNMDKEAANIGPILPLDKWAMTIVLLLLSIYFFFSFVFPIGQLLIWAIIGQENFLNGVFWKHLLDTFSLSFICGILVGGLALGSVFIDRFFWSPKDKFLSTFLNTGYAIPAIIVAIGVMTIFSMMKINLFGHWAYLALLSGFLIRFYPIGFELQNRACKLIDKKFDWVSSSLGLGRIQTFCKIHLPLLRPAVFSSMLICFLEISKEMPITLILRPYGVNTLSTKIYELTSEGEWERASSYAIFLLGLGLLSVLANELLRNRKSL